MSRQVGANVRRIRRSQGMSLDVLAGMSGLSKSFLSRVERGQRHLDRRSHLSAVAQALSCSISDLVGQPIPVVGSSQRSVIDAVPQLRRALRAAEINYVD
ncbi:MAG: helix-turn-helix domain-containing protein, partial [Gammaproteobacteria bacterium]